MPPGHDLNILLIGKIGHGKSATGNAILGEELFGEDSVQGFEREMDGRKILVVDTPGLCNTEFLDEEQARVKSEKDIDEVKRSSPEESFHAILIVLRYGVRMTASEIKAIKEIKNLLGDDSIKKHGILLFTCGDTFEWNMSGKKSFKTWCEEQKGYTQEILGECHQRCLLFDNFGNKALLQQQRVNLVRMIDAMSYKRDIATDGYAAQVHAEQNNWRDSLRAAFSVGYAGVRRFLIRIRAWFNTI